MTTESLIASCRWFDDLTADGQNFICKATRLHKHAICGRVLIGGFLTMGMCVIRSRNFREFREFFQNSRKSKAAKNYILTNSRKFMHAKCKKKIFSKLVGCL